MIPEVSNSVALLAAQLVAPTMQFIQGRKQGKQADELSKNLTDPVYNIPSSAEAALANAEAMARSRYMPGQTAFQNRIEQSTANAMGDVMRFSRSPQDAMSAITAIGAKNNDMELDLASRAAMSYQNRQGDLRQQQGIMAGYEEKKWTNDVLNKFLRDSAAASALENASIRNKYEAVKGGANAVGSFLAGTNAKSGVAKSGVGDGLSTGVEPISSVGKIGATAAGNVGGSSSISTGVSDPNAATNMTPNYDWQSPNGQGFITQDQLMQILKQINN